LHPRIGLSVPTEKENVKHFFLPFDLGRPHSTVWYTQDIDNTNINFFFKKKKEVNWNLKFRVWMHKKNNVGPIKENFAAFYLGLGPIQKTKSKVQIKKKMGLLKENPAEIYLR
jgi:hypothetical protein